MESNRERLSFFVALELLGLSGMAEVIRTGKRKGKNPIVLYGSSFDKYVNETVRILAYRKM